MSNLVQENLRYNSENFWVLILKPQARFLQNSRNQKYKIHFSKVGKEYADRISVALTTARSEYPELAPKTPESKPENLSTGPIPTQTLPEGWVNSREVTDADMEKLQSFYDKHPKGIPQFHREIQKDPEALSVLKKILELPDTASIQEVHKKPIRSKKLLWLLPGWSFWSEIFWEMETKQMSKASLSIQYLVGSCIYINTFPLHPRAA